MISFFLISLAAMCNAVMDVCQFHYDKSVFTLYNHNYWNAEISWKNKYVDWDGGNRNRKKWFWGINYPVQLTDAWHLFKSLMIVLIALSITFYKPAINFWVDFAVLGLIWNVTFNLYYNHLLMLKKK